MNEIQALGYVGLVARDLGAWRTYATEFLGLQAVAERGDETLRLRMDDHDWRIAIDAGDGDDIAYAGWQVADDGRTRVPGRPATRRRRARHR